MEKSKIILHEENCNEKDLEYVISLSCSYLLAQETALSQFDLKTVSGLQLNLGPGVCLVSGAVAPLTESCLNSF